MDQEERDHNQSLLQIYTAHLRQLELMAAKYGGLAVPSHITLEIEEHRRKIAELEARLRAPMLAHPAGPRHNLPSRDYEHFVGRQKELAEVRRLLGPRSRTVVITIDGIGGIGKSALALETAYSLIEQYDQLLDHERFDAIVWVSAKRTYLTASGIRERRQVFRTLEDVFAAIARVLDYPAITCVRAEEQREIVEQALREQRMLLILDNLETVDDEDLMDFLHELPEPAKALVTTRHRIDVARTIRLTGMEHQDALGLIEQETRRKNVTLASDDQEMLWQRTGGVPLAIVWSIGLLGLGDSIESVLRRLGSAQSNIARFCFGESIARIRGRDAERLLLALAIFERSVNRQMLGNVAGFGDDVVGRDGGLAELLQLSLVNQKGDRFSLLPLTHSFALEELEGQPDLERDLRERWITHLTALAAPFNRPHWQQPDRSSMRRDGEHLVTLANWAEQQERPDLLLPIVAALGAFYDASGRWNDMLDLNIKSIEYARLLGDRAVLRNELNWFAWAVNQQGRFDEAEQAYNEALRLAIEDNNVAWQSEILVNMSQLARRRGQFDVAEARCAEALTLLDAIEMEQQPFVRADITIEQGKIARDLRDWQRAQAHFQAAREVFQIDLDVPMFNVERAWGAYGQFAYVTHQLGRLDEAARMYRETVEAIREVGSRGYLATTLVRFATLEQQRGNYSAALEHAREALEWSRKLGMVQEMAEAEALLAKLVGASDQN